MEDYKDRKVIFTLALTVISLLCAFASLPRDHRLLSYINQSGQLKPVKTKAEWQIKRQQILDSMESVMGPLPSMAGLPPMNIKMKGSVKGIDYTRYSIIFTVAETEQLPAYLYIPNSASKFHKCPAIVALHPTGIKGKEIVDTQTSEYDCPYGKELAERGFIVIAPDYPSMGGLKSYNFKTSRYLSGTMKSIFDDMRCVDLLVARHDVDTNRIGVIGHSLGGHSAIFLGAFDTRIKVVVSSCGWTLFHYYLDGDSALAKKMGGTLWPWAQERYMPLFRTKYHLDPENVPFDFDEAIAAIAPRAFFSNSPVYDHNFNVVGVVKGMEMISRVYKFLNAKNEIEVIHPLTVHSFPLGARRKAYNFIDGIFNFSPQKR